MKTLIFLSLLLSAPASAASRDTILDRLEYACNVHLRKETKSHRAVCSCVARNLDSKLELNDLELLARSYEGNKEAEEELQKEQHNDLLSFDYKVDESCLANPKWNHVKRKK